jgi:hypothetical protein
MIVNTLKRIVKWVGIAIIAIPYLVIVAAIFLAIKFNFLKIRWSNG